MRTESWRGKLAVRGLCEGIVAEWHAHTHTHTRRHHRTSSIPVSISHKESWHKKREAVCHHWRPLKTTHHPHLSKQFLNRSQQRQEVHICDLRGLGGGQAGDSVQITANWDWRGRLPGSGRAAGRKCRGHVSGTLCLVAGWAALECKLCPRTGSSASGTGWPIGRRDSATSRFRCKGHLHVSRKELSPLSPLRVRPLGLTFYWGTSRWEYNPWNLLSVNSKHSPTQHWQ